MPTKQADIDACPVDSCDAEVSKAYVTTDGTKLTTENMVQDRTCLHPTTLDGEPASYIVFHETLEPDHAEPDVPTEAEPEAKEEEDAEEADDDAEEADEEEDLKPISELSSDSKTVFRRVMENEPVSKSELAGTCMNDGLSPNISKQIADALHRNGKLEKVDGKYVTA